MIQVTHNNTTTTHTSIKSALSYLRDVARMERRAYRRAHSLPDNVNSLPPAWATGIALVDMASYKLSNLGADQLCSLLTNFGKPTTIKEL